MNLLAHPPCVVARSCFGLQLTATAQDYTYIAGPPLFTVSAATVGAGDTVTLDIIAAASVTRQFALDRGAGSCHAAAKP